jgi:hypothetical protein
MISNPLLSSDASREKFAGAKVTKQQPKTNNIQIKRVCLLTL